MKMSIDDAKKSLEFINMKTGGLHCPMCKQRIFDLAPVELQLLGFTREGTSISLDGNVNYISVISATCKNCGYIVNFSLKLMGLAE